MTTAPSFFHNQNNTLFPKLFRNVCANPQLPIPIQPTNPEPKLLDNLFNGNSTNINTCSKPINCLGLVRPM
jgi:hypothetical protein